jgi:hypothetical protein
LFLCDNQTSQLVAGCTRAADDVLDNKLPGEVLPAQKCPLTTNANPATCAPLLPCSATEKCERCNFCDGAFLSCSNKQDTNQGSLSLDCSGMLVAGCATDSVEENVDQVERGSRASSLQMRLDTLLVTSTTLAMIVVFLH